LLEELLPGLLLGAGIGDDALTRELLELRVELLGIGLRCLLQHAVAQARFDLVELGRRQVQHAELLAEVETERVEGLVGVGLRSLGKCGSGDDERRDGEQCSTSGESTHYGLLSSRGGRENLSGTICVAPCAQCLYRTAIDSHGQASLLGPRDVLRGVFGYEDFRPGQEKIIATVIGGRDCIGVMPTGAGKSLTFQIPARMLAGTVLVVSPLISLMKDQVDALTRYGFRAAVINSSIGFDERRERLAQLRRGDLELVYVAPEGLDGSLRSLIAGANISLVVVDEAHCISEWGHDFRPAYRKLRGLKQELGGIPMLALTATATRRVAG